MVIHLIRGFLFFICPSLLFSAEFTAHVNQNQIHLGESFTLNLTLKGPSPKGTPSIDPLKNAFIVHSQQQSTNAVIINGQLNLSTTWKFTLIPQKEGQTLIPAISVETSEGPVSTEPIAIYVTKEATAKNSASADPDGLILTADVSNAKPYKSEPITYTVRLISKRDLANVTMQKIHVEDAVIELNGEPKIVQKVIDGISVGVVEFSYLITPLKAGSLKIPSSTLQGGIAIKRQSHLDPLFDDDPFSMLQGLGFSRLKPFALTTEEVVLDVQPALPDINPWLPAKSLEIEEIWNDSESVRTGEPFTRAFKITATGVKSSQLPSLNEMQIQDSSFKIYADKPEFGDEANTNGIKSYRKEVYTLIPQREGTLTLPEISVIWWDVTKKQKVVTRIPSRTMDVLPAMENFLSKNREISLVKEGETTPQTNVVNVQTTDSLLYVLIGGLGILLLAALLWAIVLHKKVGRLTETAELKKASLPKKPQTKKPVSSKREKLPDLNPT